ncbi:galactose-1-phosphate uridylyltransferase, partial [Candidatus Parcubacteria bacterium]|nr:galactose-1-phosphate uridylyltransferase [Candidatus Parcubacteria bacterium]
HTAPSTSEEDYRHYHWHLEIIPKTQVWAGFEIGTGIEISTISPEMAAAYLRGDAEA